MNIGIKAQGLISDGTHIAIPGFLVSGVKTSN
jgi:hypothetical protein